ncbi:MAG: 1-acyl-sn-glycerol-3-phosphate acyltransferase [Thermoanaerobaculum sp.]|nr:1-acyl-sn-glycerol-3-phosphate acyltransferase [Thermoanaerobaculum sp.]
MSLTRYVRALLRLQTFAVGSWLVVASGLHAVLTPFPWRWRKTAPYIARWARLGARCLGVQVSWEGSLPPAGSLVVANHQGYVDIVSLGSLFPCIFVARHDMRRWPLFGQLAASGATIFLNRENKRAGVRGVGQVREALKVGATVIAFPEGTSTDGTGLLPFRTGVFQAAVDANAPVVPAGITYLSLDGIPLNEENRHLVGWFLGESFIPHLARLGGCRRVSVGIRVGEARFGPHPDRRELAAWAEAEVGRLLGLAPGARPRRTGRDFAPEGRVG